MSECEFCGTECDKDSVCPLGCARCAYCERVVPDLGLGVPDEHQDRLWARLAEGHTADCEWIATRAHRLSGVAGLEVR